MSDLMILAVIGMVGFLCQWLATRVRMPAIIFLLMAGILLGPVTGFIVPDDLFGSLLFPYISLSVAIILFEGALTLRLDQLNEIGKPVRRMLTTGVVVNIAIMSMAAHYLLNLSWSISFLFGALMVVTGPTVIAPMLKFVKVKPKIADVLRWEGILIDPIGALIAVLFYEWIVVQNSSIGVGEVFEVFTATIAVGLAVGIGFGYLFGLLLRKHLIPEELHNFASLALVCFAYAFSDSVMHESGLLAVTVMGLLLANMKGVHIHSILHFKEDLTTVFVSALFVVLAARLDFAGFAALGWSALLLLVVMQFVARPLKVLVSLHNSDFTLKEKAMVSWIGPRGIVAAAVSAVFALKLESLGLEGADKLVPLAFLIIIGTVLFQSLTASFVAKLLGVAQPKTNGVLLIGANLFSEALAKTLNENKVETIISDTSWDRLRRARISGLKTYYGNPSSDHASMHLPLSGLGYMLGLSGHYENDIAQAGRFMSEFGARNVFVLPPNQDPEKQHKHSMSSDYSGRTFIDLEHHSLELKQLMNQGWTIKVTELSEEFDYDNWKQKHQDARPLLAILSNGDISFESVDHHLEAPSGAKLFSLVKPNTDKQENPKQSK